MSCQMAIKAAIAIAALFVGIYYALARNILSDLKRIDPDYYRWLGAKSGISGRNSLAIGEMLFDKSIPKNFYPVGIKRKLHAVRAMLYLGSLLIPTLLLTALFL